MSAEVAFFLEAVEENPFLVFSSFYGLSASCSYGPLPTSKPTMARQDFLMMHQF